MNEAYRELQRLRARYAVSELYRGREHRAGYLDVVQLILDGMRVHDAPATYLEQSIASLPDAALDRIYAMTVPMSPDVAESLAIEWHADQTDLAGHPYINHLRDVVANLGPDASVSDRIVALLHDTLEDCVVHDGAGGQRRLHPRDLRDRGVSDDDVAAICLVTKDSSILVPRRAHEDKLLWKLRTYLTQVSRIWNSGAAPDVVLRAIRVKMADNGSNSSHRRFAMLPEQAKPHAMTLRRRYAASLAMLEARKRWLLSPEKALTIDIDTFVKLLEQFTGRVAGPDDGRMFREVMFACVAGYSGTFTVNFGGRVGYASSFLLEAFTGHGGTGIRAELPGLKILAGSQVGESYAVEAERYAYR